jgi:hypothetical protein
VLTRIPHRRPLLGATWLGPARGISATLSPTRAFSAGLPGTSDPVNLWLFRAHVRVVYGRISESAYATSTATRVAASSGRYRCPPAARNEWSRAGIARFIHRLWIRQPAHDPPSTSGFIGTNNGAR